MPQTAPAQGRITAEYLAETKAPLAAQVELVMQRRRDDGQAAAVSVVTAAGEITLSPGRAYLAPVEEAWPRVREFHERALGASGPFAMTGAEALSPQEAFHAFSNAALAATAHIGIVTSEVRGAMLQSLGDYAMGTGSLAGLEGVFLSGIATDQHYGGGYQEFAAAVLGQVGLPETFGGGALGTVIFDGATSQMAISDAYGLAAGTFGGLVDGGSILGLKGAGPGAVLAAASMGNPEALLGGLGGLLGGGGPPAEVVSGGLEYLISGVSDAGAIGAYIGGGIGAVVGGAAGAFSGALTGPGAAMTAVGGFMAGGAAGAAIGGGIGGAIGVMVGYLSEPAGTPAPATPGSAAAPATHGSGPAAPGSAPTAPGSAPATGGTGPATPGASQNSGGGLPGSSHGGSSGEGTPGGAGMSSGTAPASVVAPHHGAERCPDPDGGSGLPEWGDETAGGLGWISSVVPGGVGLGGLTAQLTGQAFLIGGLPAFDSSGDLVSPGFMAPVLVPSVRQQLGLVTLPVGDLPDAANGLTTVLGPKRNPLFDPKHIARLSQTQTAPDRSIDGVIEQLIAVQAQLVDLLRSRTR